MRRLLRLLLRVFYRFETFNESALNTKGPVLLLPNHVSWWDWLLIGVCLEPDWRIVTSNVVAQTSWIHRRLMVNRRTFPVDENSPYAAKHMAEFLQKGGRLVLFPEGRISWTGSLMKLFEGTGFLIHKTRAKVITAYISGGTELPFSRSPNPKRLFPKLAVHFSDIQDPPQLEHAKMSESRHTLTLWLRDRMLLQQFEAEMKMGPRTVPEAILRSARRLPGRIILQDATLKTMSYRKLLTGAALLARQWKALKPEPRVGILLPNANAFPVTLLSLWAAGKVPAILNYTSGPASMAACARVSGLKQVITSRTFLTKGKIDTAALTQAGIELVYLEEEGKKIGSLTKTAAFLRQLISPSLRVPASAQPDPTAVILFTSGSEGEPKAVELTHTNLLANNRQMLAIIDLNAKDRFFNALPLFHSFGLSVGLLLPLVRGIYTFLYLSPLHYKVVPSAIYDLRCTVFFATNTFLLGYARKAHPYDFHTVRYIYAGAEKVQESTSTIYMHKFGLRINEGYGATECSPVISANTPLEPSHGTGGRFLPGMEYRVEKVEGVPEGGRLFVRGPNVMRGYLNPGPDAAFKAINGWYDTGDIVHVDADGFVHILGRLKRFAKVSGEMVSLTAVEDALAGAFPHLGPKFAEAIISLPDEAKGEKILLVTNDPRLKLDEVRDVIRKKGLSNLAVPRGIVVVKEIPKLGTGKTNHRELEKVVRAQMSQVKAEEEDPETATTHDEGTH